MGIGWHGAFGALPVLREGQECDGVLQDHLGVHVIHRPHDGHRFDDGPPVPLVDRAALDVARELTFSGRIFSGEEAFKLGLATRVCAAPHTEALVRFGRVVDGLKGADPLADAFSDRPDAARRLAALIAVSSSFSDALVARPPMSFTVLDLPARQRPLFPSDGQEELIRVAAAYASGELEVPETGRLLTMVADGVIASALATEQPPVPVAVIGFGKLGSEELSFASDLDVMFVYEGEGSEDFRTATATAERVLGAVRASGWPADADLRPEGRSGPLARCSAAHGRSAQRVSLPATRSSVAGSFPTRPTSPTRKASPSNRSRPSAGCA